MKQLKDKGFAASTALISAVVLVVIIAVGVTVVKHHNNKNDVAPSVSYAGWHSYCANSVSVCFKYPSSWSAKTKESTDATFVNGTKTAYVVLRDSSSSSNLGSLSTDYNNTSSTGVLTAPINSSFKFFTSSISDMPDNNISYAVVGGYFSNGQENIPIYVVMRSSNIKSAGIAVDKTSTIQSGSLFNVALQSKSNDNVILAGLPVAHNPYNTAQSIAWLNSTDGNAVLKVMQSFYVQ